MAAEAAAFEWVIIYILLCFICGIRAACESHNQVCDLTMGIVSILLSCLRPFELFNSQVIRDWMAHFHPCFAGIQRFNPTPRQEISLLPFEIF
jgi:hypothetical protein